MYMYVEVFSIGFANQNAHSIADIRHRYKTSRNLNTNNPHETKRIRKKKENERIIRNEY